MLFKKQFHINATPPSGPWEFNWKTLFPATEIYSAYCLLEDWHSSIGYFSLNK